MPGWNDQGMKARKPTWPAAHGFVLHLAHAPEVLDAVGEGLDASEHHRGCRRDVELVRLSHDAEPLIRGRLLGRDVRADAVDEYLGTAAWKRVQPGVSQALEHGRHWEPRQPGQVPDLRRAESVHVDGISRLELAKHPFVPLERQVRVHAALQQDRRTLERDGLLDLRVELVGREDVRVGVVGVAIERAEAAAGDAHVGVVDVAVDDEGDLAFGVQARSHLRGRRGQVEHRRVLEQGERFDVGEATLARCGGEREVGQLLPVRLGESALVDGPGHSPNTSIFGTRSSCPIETASSR